MSCYHARVIRRLLTWRAELSSLLACAAAVMPWLGGCRAPFASGRNGGAGAADVPATAPTSGAATRFVRAVVTKWSGVVGGTDAGAVLHGADADRLATFFPGLDATGRRDTAVAMPPAYIIVFEPASGPPVQTVVYPPVQRELGELLDRALGVSHPAPGPIEGNEIRPRCSPLPNSSFPND